MEGLVQRTIPKIHKSFGNVPVIHGVDLEVKSGEFVVFVGPSGCGKSTLLRIIAGLEEATKGTIEIDKEIVNAEKEINKFKIDSVNKVNIISEEVASNIIKDIFGEELNQSSLKATISQVIKENKTGNL